MSEQDEVAAKKAAKREAYNRWFEKNGEDRNARRRASYAASPDKHRAAQAEYAKRNPEKIQARNAAHWAKNADALKPKQRARHKENQAQHLAYAEAYRNVNREQVRERDRAIYWRDPDKARTERRAHYEANPEAGRAASARWRAENPGAEAARYASDVEFRIVRLLRARLRGAAKAAKGEKSGRTLDLLGCAPVELRLHIEAQFAPGMSWENHGLHGWHIDHIRPCASFDLTDPAQQRECFHYTNLRPLWALDNLKRPKMRRTKEAATSTAGAARPLEAA